MIYWAAMILGSYSVIVIEAVKRRLDPSDSRPTAL
jgi:hypothetical protein